MGAVQGMTIDLQELYACGADCGGEQADVWLRWRAGRKGRGTVYERVREAFARLGRRVRPTDLDEQAQPTALVGARLRRAQAPTLPPGPKPLPAEPVSVPTPPAARLSRAAVRRKVLAVRPPGQRQPQRVNQPKRRRLDAARRRVRAHLAEVYVIEGSKLVARRAVVLP